jgi:hypothetical protein
VLAPVAPYSVAPTAFRFPALAALAGRSPIGGRREIVLGTYVTARLADDTQPSREISAEARTERARNARSWLLMTALPSSVRDALLTLADATATDSVSTFEALRPAFEIVAASLDADSRAEVSRLMDALSAQTVVK